MIDLEDARAEVLSACPPRPARAVAVADALGLVLAEAVGAAESVPPFANSAMDGYAVHAADTEGARPDAPVRLRVIGTLAAGASPSDPVSRGEALRIMTGALFPEGADAVAIVENTRTDGSVVEVLAPAAPGVHIRGVGEDIQAGQELFAAGTALGPGHIGVLCSVGAEKIRVVPAPVVGVMSTGDELVDRPVALQPGQIRDSNRQTLLSLLRLDGFSTVDLGVARDDESVIEHALGEGVSRCDAVVTSGGVSMGDYDLVKAVLDRIGRMHWMQVAIRPAKPFAFGVIGDTPVFGLPGNPVSSMVSYELLARPGLRRMSGRRDDDLVREEVTALVEGDGWKGGRDGRTSFVRVSSRFGEDGRLRVSASDGQGSHQLYAMARADALAITPPGAVLSPGDTVRILRLGS